jgi:hypothetical protein
MLKMPSGRAATMESGAPRSISEVARERQFHFVPSPSDVDAVQLLDSVHSSSWVTFGALGLPARREGPKRREDDLTDRDAVAPRSLGAGVELGLCLRWAERPLGDLHG